MNYKVLAERVRYFEEDEKEVSAMCKMLEEMREETRQETLKSAKVDFAINLLEEGTMNIEIIAKCSKLGIEEIKRLKESMNCMA